MKNNPVLCVLYLGWLKLFRSIILRFPKGFSCQIFSRRSKFILERFFAEVFLFYVVFVVNNRHTPPRLQNGDAIALGVVSFDPLLNIFFYYFLCCSLAKFNLVNSSSATFIALQMGQLSQFGLPPLIVLNFP